MIEAQDLTKVYGGKAAVDHLSFTVEPGRVTGFLGPNGAGKSTTMRMILGLDRPQSGFALINGRRYRDLKDPLHTVGALLEAKSVAIGTMIRHTAGAISTIIGVVFVLPILTGLLPGSWGAHINAYLPEQAGTLITHTHQTADDLLSPWQGFGVLCIWTVLALAVAAYLLERRDA